MPDIPALISGAVCIDSCIPAGMRMSVLIYLANQIVENGGGGGGGAAQTPWTQNIDGAGFSLSNVDSIMVLNTLIVDGNDVVALLATKISEAQGDARYVLKAGDTWTGLMTAAAAGLAFNGSVILAGGANVVAIRNSTNAQTLDVYGTYTDGSNYRRIRATMTTAGVATLSAAGLGTGVAGNELNFAVNALVPWKISSAGHLLGVTDNTYDIGASGATRPRNVWVAGTGAFGGGLFQSSSGGAGINQSGSFYPYLSRGFILAPSDGVFELTDSNATNFSRLQFGGTTSSFPALKRSTTELHCRLADDSGFAPFQCANLTVNGTFSATSFNADAAGVFSWTGRSQITSRADGFIDLLDAAGTAFTQLGFGGSSSSFPAIRRTGAAIQFNLADNSEYAAVIAFGYTIRSASGSGTGNIEWFNRATLSSPAAGILRMLDQTGGDFGRLQFGGTTSSFPSLKRSTTSIQGRLADDSAFCTVQGILKTDANATTGLTAGVLASTTNATITITDASGQVYRVPVII